MAMRRFNLYRPDGTKARLVNAVQAASEAGARARFIKDRHGRPIPPNWLILDAAMLAVGTPKVFKVGPLKIMATAGITSATQARALAEQALANPGTEPQPFKAGDRVQGVMPGAYPNGFKGEVVHLLPQGMVRVKITDPSPAPNTVHTIVTRGDLCKAEDAPEPEAYDESWAEQRLLQVRTATGITYEQQPDVVEAVKGIVAQLDNMKASTQATMDENASLKKELATLQPVDPQPIASFHLMPKGAPGGSWHLVGDGALALEDQIRLVKLMHSALRIKAKRLRENYGIAIITN